MIAKRSDEATISLPSECEIRIVREFRAPRDVVFTAWSDPVHVKRWYPCEGMTMPICTMDFRVGGAWRWVQRDAGGHDHPLSGVYREIRRPERIEYTERYEPIPGSDHVVTLAFDERDGITTLTQTFVHASKGARDAHLNSGMQTGIQDTFARLDAVLASLSEHA